MAGAVRIDSLAPPRFSTLWCQPLAEFTLLALRQLAEKSSVGPKKLATVMAPACRLALEFWECRDGKDGRGPYVALMAGIAQLLFIINDFAETESLVI